MLRVVCLWQAALLNPENKIKFVADIKAEYEMMRQRHQGKQIAKDYLSIEDARKNKLQLDWSTITIHQNHHF
jgi:5-methyltetrahydrofolate--homocysteine methyltransferase